MEQFEVSLIHLIYKSTCLKHDYCNILLNNLKRYKTLSVCKRSVAQITSVSISVYPFQKLKTWSIWIYCDLSACFLCFSNPVKSNYPLCNEKWFVDGQKLSFDELGVIHNQLLPLRNHCSLPWLKALWRICLTTEPWKVG